MIFIAKIVREYGREDEPYIEQNKDYTKCILVNTKMDLNI